MLSSWRPIEVRVILLQDSLNHAFRRIKEIELTEELTADSLQGIEMPSPRIVRSIHTKVGSNRRGMITLMRRNKQFWNHFAKLFILNSQSHICESMPSNLKVGVIPSHR